MPPALLRPDLVVFDAVYNPRRTQLIQDASAAGCRTISGLEMFLGQAFVQFELWTGQPAPREVMRQVRGDAVMNVVLVGYRGTGKSAVASMLAEQLGLRVVHLDAEIERRAGRTIPEIVQQRRLARLP